MSPIFKNGAATAAFTWALAQGGSILQETNGGNSSDLDRFQRNPDLADNVSIDEDGNVTITLSISAEEGQEKARDILVERVSGERTVRGGCNIFGRSCSEEYKLAVNLTVADTGGDLHVRSRFGMAQLSPSHAEFLSVRSNCRDACAETGGNNLHINNLNLSSDKLLHEIFHNVGFKHGNRRRGDFMHTNGGALRGSHIEEIHKHYGN